MKKQDSPAFDPIAADYDNTFTRSWIGRQQRKQVWRFLEKNIPVESAEYILELNCGTGEDACMLAGRGHKVLATDISDEMLERARIKQSERSIENLELALGDMKSLPALLGENKFDLIFSNFGGLNCISPSEIKVLSGDLAGLLNDQGKIILVVMGRKCVWEKIYFYLKGNKAEARRRNSPEAVLANLGNAEQKTWYYSPEEFTNLFKENFLKEKIRPIGLFIPPSYLDSAIKNARVLKFILQGLERLFSPFPFFANYSDHYLIEFKRK